ncbi:MAG: adenosylmethionine--8-amino-7-oxononanoate transaminase [bacterium]
MLNNIEKDLQYIWHPYTQMKDHEKYPPILITRAKGIHLFDDKGTMYYDTISSWWCNIHGHNHPHINKAIKTQVEQLDHVLFAGFTHENAITLAEKLVNITPSNLTKVFYSDNGSTSVEVALKISYQFWKNQGAHSKVKFIALDNGYHGDTIGAMSVSGISLFKEAFSPFLFHSYTIPSPYCYRCPMNMKQNQCTSECLNPLKSLLHKNANQIAAIILEPLVQAAGGMIIYPPAYLKNLYTLVKEYDIHIIFDEVATGFGRTGRMFALEHVDIAPDFLCLSKGITSGYLPLGVTMTSDEIYEAFYADYTEQKTFYHGHTFTANPISTAAAIASLEIFEQDDALLKINQIIPHYHRMIEGLKKFPFIGDIRHLGMIGAIELVKDKERKTPFTFNERIGFKVYLEGLKKGLILRPLGNIIYLFLPLCVHKDHLTSIFTKLYELIEDLRRLVIKDI